MVVIPDNVPPTIAIIIINWNNPGETSRCVRGLQAWKEIKPWTIVVENGSDDGSAEEPDGKFPGVTIIKSKLNLGFTGGNILAIRKAPERKAVYILLLNNDASLSEADAARQFHVLAGRGPRHHRPAAQGRRGHLRRRRRHRPQPEHARSPDMGSESIKTVDHVPGTALLIRREAIEGRAPGAKREPQGFFPAEHCRPLSPPVRD